MLRVVGTREPRITAPLEATGRAEYAPDIKLPGMLYAKILRSPYAHAWIKKIDVSNAKALPGVEAVITYKDVPRIPYFTIAGHPGKLRRDEYILDEKVRFVGDKVAVVAAVDKDTAEEALELIDVEYEKLPAVFDPEKAMLPGAPKVHDDTDRNIAAHIRNEWGNIEKGFGGADYIFEDRYTTCRQVHAAMEPHGCVCVYNNVSGELKVWTTSQGPFSVQRVLSELFNIPLNKVQVMTTHVGGGFGGKDEVLLEPICASLSIKTGKPVKLILTREEVFFGSRTRHPCIIEIKTGVKGKSIIARQIKAILNTGAFISHGANVAAAMSTRETGLYKTPNLKFDAFCVYTNTPAAGACRGFGNPQQTFAVDSQLDDIAKKLGLDPVEFRLNNIIKVGEINPGTGIKLESCGLKECIERGANRIGWGKRRRTESGTKKRGMGVACFMQNTGSFPWSPEVSSSIVKVNADGTVQLYTGAVDIGQGTSTALAMIVAEELGVDLKSVKVLPIDTTITPFDPGTYASKCTYIAGNSVRMAARDAKMQILERASKILGKEIKSLEVGGGWIWVKEGKEKISVKEVVNEALYSEREGIAIIGKSSFLPQSNVPYFGAQFAEVEVDIEIGEVKVLKFVTASDVGKAINPLAVEGQIEGGTHMGLGYTFTENLIVNEKGECVNPNFRDYKILKATDMPEIETIIVESNEPTGPFGAKGMGEGALISVAPAVNNAIFDAVGRRIKELPLTSENVFKKLVKKDKFLNRIDKTAKV